MATVDQARLDLMNKYWNAANYLTIGQIYLKDNPLLREPLLPSHIKPRLLGHWGTSPGLCTTCVQNLPRERALARSGLGNESIEAQLLDYRFTILRCGHCIIPFTRSPNE